MRFALTWFSPNDAPGACPAPFPKSYVNGGGSKARLLGGTLHLADNSEGVILENSPVRVTVALPITCITPDAVSVIAAPFRPQSFDWPTSIGGAVI